MAKKFKLNDVLRVSLSLAKVSFRLRIEGSYLGIFWYLLNPLALFLVLLFVKETAFAGVEIPYYSLYLLIGIAGFNFFKLAITGSIDAINTNPDYIKSINKIAPESLVLSVVWQAVFSHTFELLLIIGLAIYFQVSLLGFLFYPLAFILFVLLITGISFVFATIGAYVNDLDNIWIIMSQLLLLATPIFYNISAGSLIYQVNLFNPLFYFLNITRDLIIYQTAPSLFITLMFIILSFSSLFIGILVFNRHKKKFAELL